ncbi:MAG: hypothetical protein PSV35_04395 [bacterium]|nr:hypothetical protein [bacterium]
MNSLNSTVELPHFVNAFDDVLEAISRPKCLEIISKVSLGEINPIQGLTMFLLMMQDILNDFKRNSEQSSSSNLVKNALTSQHNMNLRLIKLVIRGTLNTTLSPSTQSASEEYVQLLLRMPPEQKNSCTSDINKEELYMKLILSMQQEILLSKSNLNMSVN